MHASISDQIQQEIRRYFYFLSYCSNWHVGFQEFSMMAYSH